MTSDPRPVRARVSPSPLGAAFCVVDPAFALRLETSHAETLVCAARATAFGPEVLTRELLGASEAERSLLDAHGVVRVGAEVGPGALLIGRVAPRGGSPRPDAESLLRAVFGEARGGRDTSLRARPGLAGTVTDTTYHPPSGAAGAQATVEVSWRRPLAIGDVLVSDCGERARVAAIRPIPVDALFGADAGERDLTKAALAEDTLHARSIGPYALVTQRPRSGKPAFGGQPVTPPLVAALVAAGNPWAAWELATLKSDCVVGRTRAYESLVKGEHPAPGGAEDAVFGPDLGARDGATVPESVQTAERALLALGFSWRVDVGPFVGGWLSSAACAALSSGEVTESGTFDAETRAPIPGGLFCQRIFGPVRDDVCACGAVEGRRFRGRTCDRCGVEVTRCAVRRARFGHIALSALILHPWRLRELGVALGLSPDDVARVARGESDLRAGEVTEAGASAGDTGGAALLRAAPAAADLFLVALPVLPADLRPMVFLDGDAFVSAGLNARYGEVLLQNGRLARLQAVGAEPGLVRHALGALFAAVEMLFDSARAPRESNGRTLSALADSVRGHLSLDGLLTKPVDYSGVAHLVADPELSPGECRLPWAMAFALFKPWAYSLLEARGYVSTIRGAKEAVEAKRPEAVAAVADVAAAWVVVLATPTGMAFRRVVLWDAPAIAVDPASAAALGAETVAVHVPLTAPAVRHARAADPRVHAVVPPEVVASGWLSGLLASGDLRSALGRAGEVDRLQDPLLRIGLGCWPESGLERAPWLSDALRGPVQDAGRIPAAWAVRPVEDLGLSPVAVAALKAAGIDTVGALEGWTAATLLSRARLGRAAWRELIAAMAAHSLPPPR